MTVTELRERLEEFEQQGYGNAGLLSYDADSEDLAPVTGFLFHKETIELQTDEL